MNNFDYSEFGELNTPYGAGGKGPARSLQALPPDQRPRERLSKRGPAALSNQELLMILLNTGVRGKNVLVLAKELLDLLDRNKEIPSVEDLARIPGLGKA
jgi:DNA repair protein RadC